MSNSLSLDELKEIVDSLPTIEFIWYATSKWIERGVVYKLDASINGLTPPCYIFNEEDFAEFSKDIDSQYIKHIREWKVSQKMIMSVLTNDIEVINMYKKEK